MTSYEQLHIAGGYFVCKVIERPAFVAKDLMPPRILSASECIVNMIPDFWWSLVSRGQRSDKERRKDEKERTEKIEGFGLDPSIAHELISWMDIHYDKEEFGFRSVFFTLKLATDFIAQFHLPLHDLGLIGVGLHQSLVDRFKNESLPSEEGGPGWPGISQMIRMGLPLQDGGQPLGYEILCFDSQTFSHSWLCNSLEAASFERFGIRPNSNGFIDGFENAQRIAKHWNSDQLKPQDKPEPGLWLPWLITKYQPG